MLIEKKAKITSGVSSTPSMELPEYSPEARDG
jgi:hypothetical protein